MSLLHAAEPPKITTHPLENNTVVPGKPAGFTIQATGTEPLDYEWQWKPAEEEGRSETWQSCRAEWCDGATMTIPKAEKFNEGSYRCVISNCAGSKTSKPVQLSVGKNTYMLLKCEVRVYFRNNLQNVSMNFTCIHLPEEP